MTLRTAARLALAAVLCALLGPAAAQLLRLDEARLMARPNGLPAVDRAQRLPLHWDVAFAGRGGRAELHLHFDLAQQAQEQREPHALFITRLGSAYEIELNGVLISRAGNLDAPHDRWRAKKPVLLSVPSRLLEPNNDLRVRLRTDAGYRSGLAPMLFGPLPEVQALAEREQFWRVTLPLATSVFSLFVSGFCALLWWQQRDAIYAWAGVGEALWAVAVADAVIETAPLAWPFWGLALLVLRAAWAWCLFAIAQEVYGPRPRLEVRLMLCAQASVLPFVVAAYVLRSQLPLFIWYVLALGAWGWMIVRLGVEAVRRPNAERLMVWVSLLAVVAASLRDTQAGRWSAELYDESALAKLVAALVAMTLMWIVSRRFLHARTESDRLRESLVQQVADKEAQLRSTYESLSQAERARAVHAERERILRDMHDGVGASLATAVRQLEAGRAPAQDVVRTLRESMDHLKLSIDAVSLPSDDVNALLASLRYRLQPRIESAGLQVNWEVDALPPWQNGSDEALRHLQFLLLELISNVLQHAGASTLRLQASDRGDAIAIVLADDGAGMRPDAVARPASVLARVKALGATIDFEPAHPGTRVMLLLPQRGSA